MRKIVFTILFLSATTIFAQQTLPTKVINAALFKNGYGCIVREVTIPTGDNKITVIDDVPAPVHGTFWIIPSQDVKLISVTASLGDKKREVPAITLNELLLANVGEYIDIKTGESWISGKLTSIAENRKYNNSLPPNIPTNSSHYGYYNGWNTPSESGKTDVGNLLTIDTADGIMGIPTHSISQLRKKPGTGTLKTTFSHDETGAILKIMTNGKGGNVRIAYITRGFCWAPSYRLELKDKNLAKLTAKSVLINDAEDIITDDLSCIAGFPNIKYAQIVDPMAMQGDIAQFISQLQTPENNQYGGQNAGTQQVMMNNAYSSPAYPTLTVNPDDDKDLHFYNFKNINVKKGERMYLPLFEFNTQYTDVYKWDIVNSNDYYSDRWQNQNILNNSLRSEDIWHAIRLKNNDKQVLTTAPVTVVEDDKFIGQNLLYYTSAGGYTEINITKAIDIKAKSTEENLEAKDNININGYSYQIYINRGKLTINSYKQEDVKIIIKKDIYGDLTFTSIKPSAVNEKPKQNGVNTISTAIWEVTVPAGKSIEIEYKYKVFIR
jgi:hypothetical protein